MKNLATESAYSAFIRQYEGPVDLPRLSVDEERHLLEVACIYGPDSPEGASAIDTLVRRNARFVVKRVKHWRRFTGDDYTVAMELCQAGAVGLWVAARRYDMAHRVRLITYAVVHIDQHIRIANARQHGLTISRSLTVGAVKAAAERYRAGHGRDATPEELFTACSGKFKLDTIRGALLYASPSSLDEPIVTATGAVTLADAIAGPDDEHTHLDAGPVAHLLDQWFTAELSPRNGRIFREIALLAETDLDESMSEIGRKYGLTRERIRQLKVSTRKRLLKSTHPAAEHLRAIWREGI